MNGLSSLAASSRNRTSAYWVVTVLVAAEHVTGGFWDLLRVPIVRDAMEVLGYPLYVLTILGVWKLLGAVAILIPRSPQLKEWAYAGMFFNYTGAVISELIVGLGVDVIAYPLLMTGLTLASWALRPPSRRALSRV